MRRFRIWLARKVLPMQSFAFKIRDDMEPGERVGLSTPDGEYWHLYRTHGRRAGDE